MYITSEPRKYIQGRLTLRQPTYTNAPDVCFIWTVSFLSGFCHVMQHMSHTAGLRNPGGQLLRLYINRRGVFHTQTWYQAAVAVARSFDLMLTAVLTVMDDTGAVENISY